MAIPLWRQWLSGSWDSGKSDAGRGEGSKLGARQRGKLVSQQEIHSHGDCLSTQMRAKAMTGRATPWPGRRSYACFLSSVEPRLPVGTLKMGFGWAWDLSASSFAPPPPSVASLNESPPPSYTIAWVFNWPI